MRILAIETSCDDTAVAVVQDGRKILSNIVSSQVSVHGKYGGVVPELASRKHMEAIVPLVTEALEAAQIKLDGIAAVAVTQGPGLIGSLLVGLSFAKSLAFARGLPLIGIDHVEGHLSAIFLEEKQPSFPFVGLVVSGGHTSLIRMDEFGALKKLGQTLDDAAGEAYDKVAKLLKLGFPGGPIIDELSTTGNPGAVPFPRARLSKRSLDFSFSGLKTAVVNYVNAHPEPAEGYPRAWVRDLVSSFQEAVVDVLVKKTLQAARSEKLERIVICGGVASNRLLRQRMREEAAEEGMEVFIPSPMFCTDNAAMIGVVGYEYLKQGKRSSLTLNAYSNQEGKNHKE